MSFLLNFWIQLILHTHRLDCWGVKLVNVYPNCTNNQDGFAEQLKQSRSLFFEGNCCALAETATNTVCQKLWIILPNYLAKVVPWKRSNVWGAAAAVAAWAFVWFGSCRFIIQYAFLTPLRSWTFPEEEDRKNVVPEMEDQCHSLHSDIQGSLLYLATVGTSCWYKRHVEIRGEHRASLKISDQYFELCGQDHFNPKLSSVPFGCYQKKKGIKKCGYAPNWKLWNLHK